MQANSRDDERTPLLNGSGSQDPQNGTLTTTTDGVSSAHDPEPAPSWLTRTVGPPNTIKVLLAGFLISFSFSFTQVPIFYVFHLMECDAYYATHPPFTGPGDRCAVDDVAAGTAAQFSLLGMSTTFCGTLNLFVTGWSVKRWGPRAALVQQTFVPAVRVATQVAGVLAGGAAGIAIIQSTQLITVVGGPAGYVLVVNTLAGELVAPARRTAVFGQLQGCVMLGQAIGYLLGGMTGDAFGIRMPFQVAFFLFLASSLYAAFVLPYVSPESLSDGKKGAGGGAGGRAGGGVGGFLAPLKIMAPQRVRLWGGGGRVVKHYGVLFLCCGIFLGVLATGYAPLLIQMYATAYFDFSQGDNGWLMSGNALIRSFFLFFIFPRIISQGRTWWISGLRKKRALRPAPLKHNGAGGGDRDEPSGIPSHPEQLEAPVAGNETNQEPPAPRPPELTEEEEERTACHFDLFFLRWSLLADGLLTAGAALCTQKWHIYLAAFLLPFGSGSAPAGKGVITEMCPHSQRADALNAVTLVENVARLATQGFFGFLFSALAETGRAYLTFYANAAVAVVGMAVLYLSHFPPLGAEMVEDLGGDEEEDVEEDDDQLARIVSHETDR